MKQILFTTFLFIGMQSFAQNAYEIRVTCKPFKNQYIYLGHYFGKSYPIIDSVKLNDKCEGVFKGPKKLPGGIYLIGYPGKAGYFEIMVDKQQKFTVIADTASIRTNDIKYLNSPDNVLFNSYQKFMSIKGAVITGLKEQLKKAGNNKDSGHITGQLTKLDKEISNYREDIIRKNPNNILSALLITMREPILTGRLKEPKNKQDSLDSYNFFKKHYWDAVYFWDGRLAYTTLFEEKLDKYFEQLVVPHQDSIIKELDWMLGTASINEEMTRFLLVKFVNRYLNQKYMWEDAVFVHLFEKYFSTKNYSWLTEKGMKTITDRAYSLMANIMGNPAADIALPDSTGKTSSLYELKANYTIVVFWDPTCGHCKEVLPKLDSFYRTKWKAAGLKIFAVAKETDGSKKDWLGFINEHQLLNWTHVYYSKADDKARIDNDIPGYSQLYDVLTFPTLYLLDNDKRIVAKKLTYQQTDDVLQLKMKNQ
ncbi:MAG TPA: thioredoxin-like domain-containing protein [Chitinophagaceae bacterium]|nr:thioredoxin-like domain-containing protein [Chitinophagaceae bacterium]